MGGFFARRSISCPGVPIHSARQWLSSSSPMVHVAGSLHAEGVPLLSQICTFHQQRISDLRGFPSYVTLTDRLDRTLPLSQRSPRLAASVSALPATRMRYAVCFWPRTSESSTQLNRGSVTSIPSGLTRYSQRRRDTATSPPDAAASAAASKDSAIETPAVFIWPVPRTGWRWPGPDRGGHPPPRRRRESRPSVSPAGPCP